MKKAKITTQLMALLLTTLLVFSISGCNPAQTGATTSGSGTSGSSVSSGTTTAPQKTVTISILTLNGDENKYKDSPVQQEMTAKTGVVVEFVPADQDKLNVLLAGGDLPDIVRVDTSKFNQLIEGGNVIAMDDLLATNGKNITITIPQTVAFSKAYWSDGKNATYFLPVQVGSDATAADPSIGLVTRWDYYKEMGYPEIKSTDDFLNMLAEMVKNHPKTDDGKPVYGVSAFSDWDNWCLHIPMDGVLGYYQTSSKTELLKVDTNQITNMLLDQEAAYWKCVEYYYKANQLGILDPDALTQKFADFGAKATAGQLLSGPATWAMGDFNTNNAKDAKGFEVLPLDWGFQWGGANAKAGWTDKCFGITKNCQTPDKAMDLLDYFYSYEGSRTLFSGVEDKDWEAVGGVPTLKDATIELQKAGGDPWLQSGIGFDSNFIGLSPFTINPNDGKAVSLFNDASVYPLSLNNLQKDFAEHYGVKYPQQIFEKKIADGKSKNASTQDAFALALLPTAPDDIKRMDAKLDELCIKDAAKMILSKSDSEFSANKQSAIEDFQNAGVQQVADWYAEQWKTAAEKSAAIK
ncbi:MAG: hypothetical protein VB070_11775 [Clostridiaceae bacterium]|nr:hypothetical protein [Clostridiaceae bacterium]